MGKLQFHRKVEKASINEKDKTFSLKKKQTEIKFVIYETQAIQERTSKELNKEVQANKSIR